jgi:hypothetical protein
MFENFQGNIVRVSDVEPRSYGPVEHVDTAEDNWLSKKGRGYSALAYYENVKATWDGGPAAFLSAFMRAYNEHKDIILACDDVWTIISLHLSEYVNRNAERLRSKLVSHAGAKTLTVTTKAEIMESEWEEFLELIEREIRANTKPGVVDTFQCNFSTTGPVEKLLSTVVTMGTMKKFFSYTRDIPLCGIRHAVLLGTLEDWEHLLEKLRGLRVYAVTAEWAEYIADLEPVLEKFISTYKGNVDREFWDRVMNFKDGTFGSAQTTNISGWVLAFYGKYGKKVDSEHIADPYTNVPLLVDNQLTGQIKQAYIVGGFGGTCEVRERVHHTLADDSQPVEVLGFRPQLSFVVCTDSSTARASSARHK